jgi:hypothetical protein
MFRTDANNNPTAFTTDIAKEAGLDYLIEYQAGDPFIVNAHAYYTAKLIGDPIALTIKVIDKIGFYTVVPHQRWTYIAIPFKLWNELTLEQKKYVIGFMYQNEGGTEMKHLFV